MKKHRFIANIKKTVFFRYLFSYLLLFLLPMFVFLLLFQFHFIKLYREEVITNHTAKGEIISQVINTNLEQINSIYTQAKMNSLMNPLKSTDGMTQIKICKELNKIIISNMLLEEINFIQEDLSVVISSRLVMEKATLDKFYFEYEDWKKERMLSDIFKMKATTWRGTEQMRSLSGEKHDVITGIFPLFTSDGGNANFLQFIIDKDNFEKTIGIGSDSSDIFAISDNGGNLLYSSDPLPDWFNHADYINQSNKDVEIFSNINSFIASYTSTENDWKYYYILPLDEALEPIYASEAVYLYCFLAMILLGVLIIYFVMKQNYNPIKALKLLVENNLIKSTECIDEIKQAESAIMHLSRMNIGLEERISSDSEKLKNEFIFELFQGEFLTLNDFNKKARPYGISFNGDYLFIAIISNCNEALELNLAINKNCILEHYECCEVTFIHSKSQIFICGTEDNVPNSFEENFKEIGRQILHKTGQAVKIGISTHTFDLKSTYRKYIEAVIASENNTSAKSSICVYGNKTYNYIDYYPSDEIKEMQRAISHGDKEQFLHTFEVLRNYIENYDSSVFLRICVSYDIMNAMIWTLINQNSHSIPQDLLKQYLLVSQNMYGNLIDHLEVMDSLKACIVEQLEKQDTCEDILLHKIKAYIQEHFLDDDFSVQNVAERFSQNLSPFSLYFKSTSGVMVSQYIADLKMEYVLDLLKNTDLTLAVIAQKSGYSTTSSFIRKFKQYTGMTPGDYKKTHEIKKE